MSERNERRGRRRRRRRRTCVYQALALVDDVPLLPVPGLKPLPSHGVQLTQSDWKQMGESE